VSRRAVRDAPRAAPRDEHGFVTVAVLGLTAVLLGIATLLTTLGVIAVARHRAASAADLAALAGADHLVDGTACAVARRAAVAQSATLESCAADGISVTVVAAVEIPGLGTARARARAGNEVAARHVSPSEGGHLGTRPAR